MTPREHAAVTLHPAAETVVRFGVFRFDRGNGLLARDGEELPLPPRALAVLSVLVERAGRVVGKHELLQTAWNGAFVTETSLSEAVSLLRQTLGDDPQRPLYIQTVHRRGYRFIAPLRLEEPPARAPLASPRAAPAPAAEAAWPLAVVAAAPQGPPPAAEPEAAPPPRRRVAMGVATAALLLAALAGGFLAGRRVTPHASTPTRFAFPPPSGWRLVSYRPNLTVSPDGRRVVFTAFDSKDHMQLWVRDLASLRAARSSAPTAPTRRSSPPTGARWPSSPTASCVG